MPDNPKPIQELQNQIDFIRKDINTIKTEVIYIKADLSIIKEYITKKKEKENNSWW